MNMFKIGDIVKPKEQVSYTITNRENDWAGKVVDIYGDRIVARTIRCLRTRFIGHDFNVCASDFEMCDPPDEKKSIHITTNGKRVTAVLKDGKIIRKAHADCSPNDTFDLYTGADIALKRLFGKEVTEKSETDERFTGYAKWTGSELEGFTNGSVYQFNKGYTIDDNGFKRPCVGVAYTRKELVADGFSVVNGEFCEVKKHD